MPSASDRTLLSKSCIIAGGSSACVTCPPGPQGPQGPKGDPGTVLTFPTNYAKQVLYVGESGDISTNPNFYFDSTGGTYGATLGKLTVKGLLDPNGIQITPSVTNPYSNLQGILWVDNAYNLHVDGTTLGGTSAAGVLSVSGTTGRVTSSGGVNPAIDLSTVSGVLGSYTNSAITVDSYGRVTVASSGAAPVTSVSGSSNNITSTGGTTPVIDLSTVSGVSGSYTNSAITVDSYGRVTVASSGAAPLLLAGGTMSGSVNMGTNDITGVKNIDATSLTVNSTTLQASATGVTISQPLTTAALSAAGGAFVAGTTSVTISQPLISSSAISAASVAALSLEVAKAPTAFGAPTTTALYSAQNDMNATATNNVLLSQGSTFFLKPVANPVVQLDTIGATNLYTFLVPQFYGEHHVATGTVTNLYYDTSANINIAGTTLNMNPYYCSLTNGTGSTLNVQVRYGSMAIVFPPAGPTTTPRIGVWTPQSVKITGGTTTTTPTLSSGSTKTLFLNNNGWFLM